MKHNERKVSRRFDLPYRGSGVTDIVYSGQNGSKQELIDKIRVQEHKQDPPPSEYKVYFGELHGHTNLSDGRPDLDEYFINLRDKSKLDFAAISDHDHGGVGKAELWDDGKWDKIRDTVKKYNEPGRFTTLLAYERDSYPWYNNMIVYYNNHNGELLRGEQDGELTRAELHSYLSRDDLILIPHDTSTLLWGTDFHSLEISDMTPLLQVYSRYNHSERRDMSLITDSDCEGGHWQDALERGAKMGCVAGSDDHSGTNGQILPEKPYPHCFPGITAVLAKENTLAAIFEALKARRCYALMGGRIALDFRVNGHYMGEEITDSGDRNIYFKISADGDIDTVTIVKNSRDYIVFKDKTEYTLIDYKKERPVDYYYLRIKLKDGRIAWSSPVWITA